MTYRIQSDVVIDDNKVFFPNNSSEKSEIVSISSGSITLDLNSASIFEVTLNGNLSTINISNVQTSGKSSSFVLITVGDGTERTITWPASFKWKDGVPPATTYANGKKDVYVFFTIDGGTTYNAFVCSTNL